MPHDYGDITFYVYIMASQRNGALYTGMTGCINRRTYQHVNGLGSRFSKKRHTDLLVYFEEHPTRESAKRREDRIKHWERKWKIEMIGYRNPTWMDLCHKVGVGRPDAS